MSEPQRYEMVERTRGMESWHELEHDPEGEWMRYEDYAALAAQFATANERLREARRIFALTMLDASIGLNDDEMKQYLSDIDAWLAGSALPSHKEKAE